MTLILPYLHSVHCLCSVQDKNAARNSPPEPTEPSILVSNLSGIFASVLPFVKLPFLQILHMDAGDTLELRMTRGDYIHSITLNIELTGFGFD